MTGFVTALPEDRVAYAHSIDLDGRPAPEPAEYALSYVLIAAGQVPRLRPQVHNQRRDHETFQCLTEVPGSRTSAVPKPC